MTQPINNILEAVKDIRKATLALESEKVADKISAINELVDELEHQVRSLDFDINN